MLYLIQTYWALTKYPFQLFDDFMMKLSEWIKSKNLTLEEAAKLIGAANGSVVERWSNGKQLPRPSFMQKIFVTPGGLVRPDDFYDLPPVNQENDHVRAA